MSAGRPSLAIAVASLLLGLILGWSISGTRRAPTDEAGPAPSSTAQNSARELANRVGLSAPDDPFIAILSARQSEEGTAANAELFWLLERTPAGSIPQLIERAQRLPMRYREFLVGKLFAHWLKLDQTAAEQWIRTARPDSDCYISWAKVSPRKALLTMLGRNGVNFPWAIDEALERIAGKDHRARMTAILTAPDTPNRWYAAISQFEGWSNDNPADALRWTDTLPRDAFRTKLEQTALLSLAKVDASEAVVRMAGKVPATAPGLHGDAFISEFTLHVAGLDRARAIEFVSKLPPDLQKEPKIAVAYRWAADDAAGALRWAYDQGVALDDEFHNRFGFWHGSPLEAALSAASGPTAEFLLSLPDSADRDRWLERVVGFRTGQGQQPGQPKAIFDALPLEGQLRVARSIGHHIAASSPSFPDPAAWKSMFPNDDVRRRAIIGGLSLKGDTWSDEDFARLDTGIRDAYYSDTVLNQLGFPILPIGDEIDNALRIENETLRRDTLDEYIPIWMRMSPGTAEKWIESHPELPGDWIAGWKAEATDR